MQFWPCLIDIHFFLLFETYRVTNTNISPGDLSMSRADEINLRTDLFSSRTQVLQEVIFHATHSNNSLRDKINGGPLFSV